MRSGRSLRLLLCHRACDGRGSRSLSMNRSPSHATSTLSGADKIGIAIFSGISAVAFYLGTWQYQRYNWKTDLIADGREKMQHAETELSESSNVVELMGKKVKLCGTFDHSREVKIGLRAPPAGTYTSAQGMGTNPQGYYIITPMKLSFGPLVYVNRGWIPRDSQSWDRPDGIVTISAIVSEPEKGGAFAPSNDVRSGKLLWVKRTDLLAVSKLTEDDVEYEIYEEINRTGEAMDSPVGLPVKRSNKANDLGSHYVTPETHLAYSFTWFSLSAIGLAMTYYKFRGPRKFGLKTK